jgi:hypothetical protein
MSEGIREIPDVEKEQARLMELRVKNCEICRLVVRPYYYRPSDGGLISTPAKYCPECGRKL